MSWTHDFGVVADAEELRAQEIVVDIEREIAPSRMTAEQRKAFEDEQRAVRAAIFEHIEAARDAAALLLESPAFADAPCAVFASGQAQADHTPAPAQAERVKIERRNGEVVEVEGLVAAAAREQITITVTQQG